MKLSLRWLLILIVLAPLMGLNTARAALEARLDRIILLMAVNLSGSPALLPMPGSGELVIFGAVSAEAAVAAMNDLIKPLGEAKARTIRFAPVSYRYLLGSVSSASSHKTPVKVVLLPDPTQVKIAESLYRAQGSTDAAAQHLARNQPTVFCPEPAIYAIVAGGNNSGKRMIPCSFDHDTVSNIVARAKLSPGESRSPKVAAIPWDMFIKLLNTNPSAYLDDLEVLLSPETQKAIVQTRENRQYLLRK